MTVDCPLHLADSLEVVKALGADVFHRQPPCFTPCLPAAPSTDDGQFPHHLFHVPYKGSLTPDVFHCVHTSMGNVNNKPNNSNGPPCKSVWRHWERSLFHNHLNKSLPITNHEASP